jgi:hypothetical protein
MHKPILCSTFSLSERLNCPPSQNLAACACPPTLLRPLKRATRRRINFLIASHSTHTLSFFNGKNLRNKTTPQLSRTQATFEAPQTRAGEASSLPRFQKIKPARLGARHGEARRSRVALQAKPGRPSPSKLSEDPA